MDKLPERLSIAQVVELLQAHGITRTKEAVRKRIVAGDLPAEKVGKQWTVAYSHAEAYGESLRAKAKGKAS